jgi:hypothetical protein
MWNLSSKQLAYVSFYYGSIVFLIACIFYDLFQNTITGFTFGYVFALFYMIARTRAVLRLMEDLDDYQSED